MKRRREIGPKIEKNRRSLTKYLLIALVVAVVGGAATVLLRRVIGPSPVEDEGSPSVKYMIVPFVLAGTILSVLGIVFFGVRSYLGGTKARHSLQSSRMKIKR